MADPTEQPQRVRGTKLGTTVVHQIVHDIVGGFYPQGSTLPPEADLCNRFAVSRTVVRESLKIVQENLESVTVVTDDEAVREIKYIAERLKVFVEPASSCNLAAAERLRENFTPDSHIVIILCGGNFSITDLCAYGANA